MPAMPTATKPDAGEPLIEDLSDSPQPGQSSTKRKRTAEDDEAKRAQKRKKRTKKKPTDIDDANLDDTLGINHAIAQMDPALLADHLAQRTRRFHPDWSLVELEELHIPAHAIKDTTTFEQLRTADHLAAFVEAFAAPRRASKEKGKSKSNPALSDAHKSKGTPHTLILAASGQRAADLTRALRSFQTKEAIVAKLFAKHIKLAEAVDTTKKTRMNFGVGTPQRMIDLVDAGALSLAGLERVLVDASHIDAKKRGVLDLKEVQEPLVRFLGREDLRGRFGGGGGGGEGEDENSPRVEVLFF